MRLCDAERVARMIISDLPAMHKRVLLRPMARALIAAYKHGKSYAYQEGLKLGYSNGVQAERVRFMKIINGLRVPRR